MPLVNDEVRTQSVSAPEPAVLIIILTYLWITWFPIFFHLKLDPMKITAYSSLLSTSLSLHKRQRKKARVPERIKGKSYWWERGVKNEEVHKPVQWAPVLFWELWTQEWKKKKKKNWHWEVLCRCGVCNDSREVL